MDIFQTIGDFDKLLYFVISIFYRYISIIRENQWLIEIRYSQLNDWLHIPRVNYGYRYLYVWIFPEFTIITINSKTWDNKKFVTIWVFWLRSLSVARIPSRNCKSFFWLQECRQFLQKTATQCMFTKILEFFCYNFIILVSLFTQFISFGTLR